MLMIVDERKYPDYRNNIVLKYLLIEKGIILRKFLIGNILQFIPIYSFLHYSQQSLRHALDTLDHQNAIYLLNSLNEFSHFRYCKLAYSYFCLNNYQKSLECCQIIFKQEIECQECIFTSVQSIIRWQNAGQFWIDKVNYQMQKCIGSNNQKVLLAYSKFSQFLVNNKIENFMKSLKREGGLFSKIQLVQESLNYRRIVAKERIDKDQVIMYIPKQQMITLQTTKNSSTVRKLFDLKIQLRSPKHCLLSIYLLQQKLLKKQSIYYPYISLLPTNYDNFPLNYTKEQMNQLKGSSFYDQIEQKSIDMRKDYQVIIQADQTFKKFTYNQFRWARMTVSSRIFGIVINKIKTDALVPLADMLNHQIPKQTSWYYSDIDSGFIIRNIKTIENGSQIYDSYGQKCNSRFLLNYGFTLLQNSSNQVVITVPLKSVREEDHANRQILLRIGRQLQSKQFQDMIGVFRYAVMNEQEISQLQHSSQQAHTTKYHSQSNQILAWQLIEQVMNRHLSQYPSSMKEDKKLLTNKDLPTNKRNCIILRLGEKQILQFYLTMSKKILRFLKSRKKGTQLYMYESYLINLPFF